MEAFYLILLEIRERMVKGRSKRRDRTKRPKAATQGRQSGGTDRFLPNRQSRCKGAFSDREIPRGRSDPTSFAPATRLVVTLDSRQKGIGTLNLKQDMMAMKRVLRCSRLPASSSASRPAVRSLSWVAPTVMQRSTLAAPLPYAPLCRRVAAGRIVQSARCFSSYPNHKVVPMPALSPVRSLGVPRALGKLP